MRAYLWGLVIGLGALLKPLNELLTNDKFDSSSKLQKYHRSKISDSFIAISNTVLQMTPKGHLYALYR